MTSQSRVVQICKNIVIGLSLLNVDQVFSQVADSLVHLNRERDSFPASINARQINYLPISSTTYAMQGWLPGVDVVQSNDRPGGIPSIRIRGNRSLNGIDHPLFVLNGIPLTDGFSIDLFNPADIQEIRVLKDAAATAAYGMQGANGVVLVSTRPSINNTSKLNYQAYYGVTEPLQLSTMMSGAEYAEYRRDAYRNYRGNDRYSTPYPNPVDDYNIFSWPLAWDRMADAYEWEDRERRIPKYRNTTAAERQLYASLGEGQVDQVPVYDAAKIKSTDWADLVLQTGTKQNHHLNFSSSGETLSSIFSLSYYQQEGLQKGQGLERLNGHTLLEYRPGKKLKMGLNALVSSQNQDWGANVYNYTLYQSPLVNPYDPQGNPVLFPSNSSHLYTPLNSIKGEIDDRDTKRYFGSLFTEFTLWRNLSYSFTLGLDHVAQRIGIFQASETFARPGNINFASLDYTLKSNFYLDHQFRYRTNILKKHVLNVLLFNSFQRISTEREAWSVIDLPLGFQTFYGLNNTSVGTRVGYLKSLYGYKLHAWMLQTELDLFSQIKLSATARLDRSKPKFVTSPTEWLLGGVGLSWELTKAKFLQNKKVFESLKLRASWGNVGNTYAPIYVSTNGNLADAYKVSTLNAGLDFAFLKDRFWGHLDVYDARTSPQQQTLTLNGQPIYSFSTVQNKGIELGLNWFNLRNKNWSWQSSLTFTHNREKVREQSGEVFEPWKTGHPIHSYYRIKPIGVWSTQEATIAAKYWARPGFIKYADINQDSLINADDRVVLGNNNPNFWGNFYQVIIFKNWELSALLFARIGQMVPNELYQLYSYTDRNASSYIAFRYWTPARQDGVIYAQPDLNNTGNSSAHTLQDGSFVKLRSVALAYRTKSSHFRISLTAYNPLLITRLKLTDPEFYDENREVQVTNLSERGLVLGLQASF